MWVGNAAPIDGMHATYYTPYSASRTYQERISDVMSYLDLPLVERPSFLTLYFERA